MPLHLTVEYIGGTATLSAISGEATPDASLGRSQKFIIDQDTELQAPINLENGQSMTLGGLQDVVGGWNLTLAGEYLDMSGLASNVVNLSSGGAFEVSIRRLDNVYRTFFVIKS